MADIPESPSMNLNLGPIQMRVMYWSSAVGSSISTLVKRGFYPREIRVFKGGNLNVTYADGTNEIVYNIPDGAIFVDACWASISATSSTAYAIYVGW